MEKIKYVRIPIELEYGKNRREFIKNAFSSEGARLYVNSRYCIQLKNDPDLKKLIKSGFLKVYKERESFTTFHRTYLTRV